MLRTHERESWDAMDGPGVEGPLEPCEVRLSISVSMPKSHRPIAQSVGAPEPPGQPVIRGHPGTVRIPEGPERKILSLDEK